MDSRGFLVGSQGYRLARQYTVIRLLLQGLAQILRSEKPDSWLLCKKPYGFPENGRDRGLLPPIFPEKEPHGHALKIEMLS